MLLSVSCLAKSEFCMSAYLRVCLLGALAPMPALRVVLPSSWNAPGLRPLNPSQTSAVDASLKPTIPAKTCLAASTKWTPPFLQLIPPSSSADFPTVPGPFVSLNVLLGR
ncbi:hypothetical protein AB1Y20_018281 [Prymnesium parvum]|uniref:Secreted protein n=1 Tax=Prymnesium parvum TaxID=97485 RepID=A0AB34JMX9_PRYPA